MIWTRVSADADSVPVNWTMASDPELTDVVAAGEASAEAEHDHTVQVDVGGLEPGAIYHYGFEADGETSPVARAGTLRAEADRLRFATCSCAKFNAGYFNAYARIAERDDLDFLLHLGDYIYEAGNIPAKGQTPGADIGRDFEPLEECRTLADYRTRYAQYKRDPDVQALQPDAADHSPAGRPRAGRRRLGGRLGRARPRRARPLGGAARHRVPGPVGVAAGPHAGSGRPHPGLPAGQRRRLADFFLLDIRSRRDQPVVGPGMEDPDRSMLGAEQREWLFESLDGSAADWRLLASPSILVRTWCEQPNATSSSRRC